MSEILLLGGTGWLGRKIVESAIAAGNRVTCLARGESGQVPSGATLVRADRRAPGAYDEVASRDWDDVIEVSWDNALVTQALAALAPRAAHWTLVSTISVYASNGDTGADESAEVVEPLDLDDYGQAKVAAERASAAALGDRLLAARAGLICGPGDPSDRFGYWVARMAAAPTADILSPEAPGRSVQAIDVRDLASWIASAQPVTGTINAIGSRHAFVDVLDRAATVAGYSAARVEATDDWLLAHDVGYWAGGRSLPLWLPREDAAMAERSDSAFIAAGGIRRDLDETLRDVLANERARGLGRARRAGLTREDESELLRDL
ncbi:MAG TPA: NAD-dependent epimerase/dehydratase family protein [Galbitalea sp.]|jgi:nucleoside-diphosphate-sugar epimerase